MPAHNVFSSNGTSLEFTKNDTDLYSLYQLECRQLDDRYYAMLRKRNGVYASNQGKYVESPDQLNPYDGHLMEDRFKEIQKQIALIRRK